MSKKDEEGYGNAGWWKTRKTKSRFSVVSHRPWKSPQPRFPHSHSPGGGSRGKVEIQNQDSHFPTASPPSSQPKTNTKQKHVGFADFRLILGLENGPRLECFEFLRRPAQSGYCAPLDRRGHRAPGPIAAVRWLHRTQ